METARLPEEFANRYRDWKTSTHEPASARFRDLVDNGQRPTAMVVSCCDSRVNPTDIFGGGPGSIFVHRNIANLVPPHDPGGNRPDTQAALEFAVGALAVERVIVLGHSQCGGIRGCRDICAGEAPDLEASLVGKYLEVLRPHFGEVSGIADPDEQSRALERHSVRASLRNLATYPFVVEAVSVGRLSLHGLWIDIASGELLECDVESGAFRPA